MLENYCNIYLECCQIFPRLPNLVHFQWLKPRAELLLLIGPSTALVGSIGEPLTISSLHLIGYERKIHKTIAKLYSTHEFSCW
jgi:hypothetical protein